MPAEQDSLEVWAELTTPALFLCQDLLARRTCLGEGVPCPEVALEGRV